MNRVLGTKVTIGDYINVKNICKEFRIKVSDFLRSAIYNEIQRLKNLSEEEKKQEINSNVQWGLSMYRMNQARRQQ